MRFPDDPEWEPPNPPEKLVLPSPVHFFSVTSARDDEDGLGWKYLGTCKPRATCCGSRAELRFPDGKIMVVRIGGITGASIIVSKPKHVGEVPLGTEVWLLETEATDYAALVSGDKNPPPMFSAIGDPVDHKWRRHLRVSVDEQLAECPPSASKDLLNECRVNHPIRLADGFWVVYELPSGQRVLFYPDDSTYWTEPLEGQRLKCGPLEEVTSQIVG